MKQNERRNKKKMKEFTIRVKMKAVFSDGSEGSVFRTVRERSKTLRGAIRKIFQDYPDTIDIVRIIEEV